MKQESGHTRSFNSKDISAGLLIVALGLSPVIGGGFGELAAGVLQVLVLAAIAVYALGSREDRVELTKAPGLLAITVFLIAVLISTLFSEAIYSSFRFILLTTACLGAYLLGATLFKDTRYMAAAMWTVVVSSLLVCMIGIRHYAISTGGGAQFWKALMSTSDHMRLFGPFINPGFFAGYLVIAIPVTLGVYLITRRGLLAFIAGMAVVLETLALMLTGTKFGVVSAVAGLGLFFIVSAATKSLRRSKFARLVILAVVMLPLLVVFSRPVFFRISEAEAGGSQVHSTTFRIYTWKATLDMARHNPLVGTGPGTYEISYPRYSIAGPTKHAHQTYLQIASESGVLAAGALVVALLVIAVKTLTGIIRAGNNAVETPQKSADEAEGAALSWKDMLPSSGQQMMACALYAALAGSVLRNLVDSDWYVIGIALPFWTLAGALVAVAVTAQDRTTVSGRFKMPVTAACAVLTLLSISFALGDYITSNLPAPGSESELKARIAVLHIATQVSPLNPVYHRELANYLTLSHSGVDTTAAARHLETATRLAPTDSNNYYVRAMLAMRKEDFKAAAKYLQTSLIYRPNSTQSLYLLSVVYEKLGDTKRLESTLKRMLKIEESPYEQIKGAPELVDTTYTHAHLYFGSKLIESGDYGRAAEHYNAAVQRMERWRSNEEMLEMARVTGMLSEEEEAQLLDVLQESYSGLAEAYSGMGRMEEAEEARRKAESVSE